uniref:Uncharacterized protein n=1 Tax=Ditylenchus dipsaci TaxID=166011 RepID=A0A915DR45_9BILA
MEEFLSKIEKKEVTVLLSHYELKRMLGKGEDGCVFLADCTTDKKQCAIKFGNEVKQFFVFAAKENEVLLLMQGKGIPKIHDIFRQLDRSFLASELVGDSLHKIQEKCGGKISLKMKPSLEIWYNILPFLCADQLDKIELVNRELTVIKKRFFRKHPYCSMYAMFIRSKGYYIVKECPVVGEVTENHPHFPLEEPDININNYRRVSARMIAEQMGQVVKPNVRFKVGLFQSCIILRRKKL